MKLYTPRVLVAESENEFPALAATAFLSLLEEFNDPLVTLPTGRTPLGMYSNLASGHAQRRDLWDRMRFVSLDEYAGLSPDDPRLFYRWLAREFLDPVRIPEPRRTIFNSAANPGGEARRMSAWLQENGPLNIAVVGIGVNGHVAFNEPGTPFDRTAHDMKLTPETIRANARYWGGEEFVPREGMTLGLKELSEAQRTLVIVDTPEKAGPLAQALKGPVTPALPASYLQTIPDVTVVADRAAALYL